MSLNDAEWLTEVFENKTAFSVRYVRKLFDEKSRFQHVQIFETEAMGRALILNGCFMLTEKDAWVYHEMLVHPAMQVVKNPRKILIIGGGDGGAVSQVVRYPQAESIVLCEIDSVVVESSRRYLPEISAGLEDPRVDILLEDGAVFVSNHPDAFDLVFVDSTDPVGPAEILFQVPFYQSVKKSLRKGGVAVFQTESPLFMRDVFVEAVSKLRIVFGSDATFPYFATVPCYPGGLWSFTFCSVSHNPVREAPDRLHDSLREQLQYYNEETHRGAFARPIFVQKALEGRNR